MSNNKNRKKLSNLKKINEYNQTEAMEGSPIPAEILDDDSINDCENTSESVADMISTELEQLKVELESKQMEMLDWKNKAMRAIADMENSKKQQELDAIQIKKTVKKNLSKPILDFLNHQFLIITYLKDITDQKALTSLETLKISFNKLVIDLKSQGIEVIIPEIGDDFNPEFMQGLNTTENAEAKIENIVSLGLRIDTQVISPAMIMFAQ
jgi:molecular chaperone GrpE (heat shock protein)